MGGVRLRKKFKLFDHRNWLFGTIGLRWSVCNRIDGSWGHRSARLVGWAGPKVGTGGLVKWVRKVWHIGQLGERESCLDKIQDYYLYRMILLTGNRSFGGRLNH